MKVLLVNKFHYRKGGSETYYFEIAEALRQMGHEVVFFSMYDPSNEPCEQSEYFVSASDYNGSISIQKKIKEAASIAYNREAKEKFEALLQAERPDVIHLNLVHRQITLSILDAPSAEGIPVVFTSHDYILVCPNYTMLDGEGRICDDCLNGAFGNCLRKKCVKGSRAKSALAVHEAKAIKRRGLYRKIDQIIAPSEFMARTLIQGGFPANRIVKMVNFVPHSIGEDAIRHSESMGTAPYFVFFGRLSAEKGVDVLVKSFAQVASSIPNDWRLFVVGDGPQREELQSLAATSSCSGKITFTGYKSGNELHDLIYGSKYVICPSVWYENMPYSVIEALALGKPVIGSDIGGIPEMVIDGSTGFLCKPGDISSLQETLIKAANLGDKSYLQMAESCRAHIAHHASKDAYMERLITLYERLIREKSARSTNVS